MKDSVIRSSRVSRIIYHHKMKGDDNLTDEELVKCYDEKFWELVNSGLSIRKSKKLLKDEFPTVTYDSKNDKWIINGVEYTLDVD